MVLMKYVGCSCKWLKFCAAHCRCGGSIFSIREAVKDGSVETLYSLRAGRRLENIQPSMTKVQRLRVTCELEVLLVDDCIVFWGFDGFNFFDDGKCVFGTCWIM
jgi:hypothetical protein